MTSVQIKRKRTRILVEKRSQLYLSLLLVLYFLVYTLVLLTIMLAPSIITFSRGTLPLEQRFAASREFLLLDQRVVPAVLLVMLLLAVHFIFISNRIFGPLHRLRTILANWREGSWPQPLHVRPKDFHQELFDEVNGLADRFGGVLFPLRDHLTRALEAARNAAGGGQTAGATERLKTVEEECRLALEQLDHFTRQPRD